MNLDDFPFNEFIKELLEEKGKKEKVEMSLLVREVRTYVGEKEKRKITNRLTEEDAEVVVGILKTYVELGYVEEDITDIEFGGDGGQVIGWNKRVEKKSPRRYS